MVPEIGWRTFDCLRVLLSFSALSALYTQPLHYPPKGPYQIIDPQSQIPQTLEPKPKL